MRAVTHALLSRVPLPSGPILELGCGSGLFNAELQCRYRGRLSAGWIYTRWRWPMRQRLAGNRPPLIRADVQRLPNGPATLGAILALDTFDQRGVDVDAALRESWRILQPGGLLMVRVSAHPWLQGDHDTAFNTGHRFRQNELIQALKAAGFTPLLTTYANALLAPPLVLLRLLERGGWLTLKTTSLAEPPLKHLFIRALRLEARWLAHGDMRFGISLYAVASKQRCSHRLELP